MRNKYIVALMVAGMILSASAGAIEGKRYVGINFSTGGAYGIEGDYDISDRMNNAPVSVQAFLKQDILQYPGYGHWNITGIGVAGIYDFSAMAKLDPKLHPYAGAGAMYVNYNWTGYTPPSGYTGVGGGLYVTAGIRFDLDPKLQGDFSYNNFGDLTLGINLQF